MSFCEILLPYNSGLFNVCLEFFNGSSETSRKQINLDDLDEIAKRYLFENNTIVCETLQEHSRTNLNWNVYLDRFIKLYSKYRSLPIPLDLELNICYNILWWYSIKYELSEKSLYLRNVLDVISGCMAKVVKFSGEVALSQKQCVYDETRLVNQLNLASDTLLQLSPVSSVQLLGVITLTVLVLLRRHDVDCRAQCVHLAKKCINQMDLLELHMRQKVICGNEEIFFKFGLISINSTASIKSHAEILDAFVIVMSLVCILNGEYKLAIDYLISVSARETKSFQFLVNYVRAYCHYHLQQYNEAKLCLAYSTSSPAATRFEAHYRLLLARLLSSRGDHQAALVECEAVIASQPAHTSLACHLATTLAQQMSLTTAHLHYLNKLVQCLKSSPVREQYTFEGFEECCVNILCEQYCVTLHEALYLLARQLYLAGYHMKALSSYCELLELLKSGTVDQGKTKLLPRKAQILHETVLAHIKANNLKDGEQLCRQLIREYVPTSAKGLGKENSWEAALYSLEDDVISMTLLADIMVHSDKRKAVDELNRCYNALHECQEQAQSSPGKSEPLKELCGWFMSRVLLRKAKLSSNENSVHLFRRALIHKPGDKEVIFHYRQWALWNPDHESFDPGDQIREVPVDELHSLALRHLLGCSVTDEEWAALCDQESSHNVLESLFDDDDD